jgi:hypothetical protein
VSRITPYFGIEKFSGVLGKKSNTSYELISQSYLDL